MKNTESNKSHVCIMGTNFYITWESEKIGFDQRGVKWINKDNPECTNKEMVNVCLDTYNKIMALNK